MQPGKAVAKQQSSLSVSKGNYFLENKEQITDQYGVPRKDIDFRLVGNGVSLFIGSGHMHYQWYAADDTSSAEDLPRQVNMYRMDVLLVGANMHATATKEKLQHYFEHYYVTGKDITVGSYERITYKNIYPNIDWVLYIKNGIAEYDFVIRPGGKVSDIQIAYDGATDIQILTNGCLRTTTPLGYVEEQAPIAFDGTNKVVTSRFALHNNVISFTTAPYEGKLTIDPSIDWGTYLGGLLYDQVYFSTCDDSGYVYVTGSTASVANIATTGSYQNTYGGGTGTSSYLGDGFVSKFNKTGACLWSTY
ncbi:MAG: hypothetical protein EOP51_33655, partial [Sphingobacteriales bacterium]